MSSPEELDLDPIETTPDERKGKGSKGQTALKPVAAKPKNGRVADDDERSSRKSVAGNRKVPYPPSPTNVPDDLTDYAGSYLAQQNKLLAGLFLFLIFYVGLVLFFALVAFWCVWTLHHLLLLKIFGLCFSGFFFLYLVRGFFKRHPTDKEMHIEITEEDHPVLFEFIYELCDELGAPLPNRVFVSSEVNASVMPRTSLINLLIQPKKDLIIGLGLVNCLNLSEFKSVMAHEFGHFSQSAVASSYAYVANRIIEDLVWGEDWLDVLVKAFKRPQPNPNAGAAGVIGVLLIGYMVGGILWAGRKVLAQCYQLITLQRLVVSREREFHADLVAVSAAGSNAIAHMLLRLHFGHQCYMQAIEDMLTARDHKLYSNDMYLHQDRAAAVVRRKKKEPHLGLPPHLTGPDEGKDVEVFDAEEEAMFDEIPPMWRTHPSNSDREKNAKERFVPAAVDHRSPWILFDEPADIRERMTYKFYRMHYQFRLRKDTELDDAMKVQVFIDNEHSETTYDPKYKGAYDGRPIVPGNISELNGIARDAPWTEDRMEKVLDKLYDGCAEHAEAHADLYKEMQALRSGIVGRPSKSLRSKMDDVKQQQDENVEWLKSFDRRVYLLHVQMAARVDPELQSELVERYRFQLEVQRFFFDAREAHAKAADYFNTLIAIAQGKTQVHPEFFGELMQALRESWKELKFIIRDAREINLPAMKNFEEGDNLGDFILVGKMVPEPPLTYVKGVWINKLLKQLQGVQQKCARLHFKSLGGILRVQETVATQWRAQREPVAAEVLDAIDAAAPGGSAVVKSVATPFGRVDIVSTQTTGHGNAATGAPDEIIAAEVLPDEPIPAEIIDAEVLDADVLPSEPVPAAPAASEPSKPMAAFASPAAPPAGGLPPPPPPGFAVPPPVVHAPERPVVAAPVSIQSLPSADPFDFRAPEVKPAAPAFDPEAARPAPPKSVPSAPEPAPPAPAAQLPADAVGQIFTLNAAAPAAENGAFELAAGDPPPGPVESKSPTLLPKPGPPVPAKDVFSLDAEETLPPKPVEAPFSLDTEDYRPAPPPATIPESDPKLASSPDFPAPAPVAAVAKPARSDAVEVPASKPGFGSGVSPVLGSANSRRPRLKITIVRPGEKSPLAK